MTDHTAALREAFKAWWSDISRKGDPQHRPNLTAEAYEAGWEDCRIAVLESTPPAPAEPQGDSDEAAEILRNLIANIEEDGLYSEEGMLTFLTQALSCLKPANAAHPSQQEDDVRDADEIFDWLETELSAIDCRYRGDPSYDHDAYWMRERVLKLIAEARTVFSPAAAQGDAAQGGGKNG